MRSVSRRRRRALVGFVAATALVAFAATACSSSSSSPAASSSSPAASSSTSSGVSSPSSSGAPSSSGTAASGSPIILYGVTTYNNPSLSIPEINTGAQAAAKAINAAGGINGHPLQVTICDDNFNPNQAQSCAEAAVSHHATAVIAAQEFVDPNYFPTLEKAGIPSIEPCGCSPAELTEPSSFPLDGALPTLVYGDAAMLVKLGVKHPAQMTCETASCAYDGTLGTAAFKVAGITPVRTVISPLASVDDTSAAAETIAGGVDGVIISSSPEAISKMIEGLRGAGFTGPIALTAQTFTASVLQSLGANTSNLVVAATFDPVTDTSDPQVALYVSQMKAYTSNPVLDLQSQQAWLGVTAFATVAKTLPTVTAATVMKAFSNIPCSKPLDPGLINPYCTQPSPLASAPRLLNFQVRELSVKNGALVTSGPFFNPLTALEAAKTGS
jgi:branched-chain amino acid transport system substrate-binding protein